MPANTAPIFTLTPDVSSNNGTTMNPTLTTAAADYTGVSANNKQVFKAGANGGYVRKLRFKAIGTNVQTVARIYANNGSTNTTAANNSFLAEITLPATTASNTVSTPDVDVIIEAGFNATFAIYVGLATTVAAGWVVTPIAGQY
jgi:hypothetical protein